MFGFDEKKILYPDPVLNEGCSEFEVNNWILSDFVVKKLFPVTGTHPFPLNEQMLMSSAVCRFKPCLIFEWGTNIGKSARIFYETITAFGIDCKIHSIDLPDDVHHGEHPQKERGKLVKGLANVTLHQADGVTCSLEMVDRLKPAGNVLFFIDGDHQYDSVKRELQTILKTLPGAIILLHDTFYQSENSGYNTGPLRAIQDTINPEMYREISTTCGLPGMTLLYKKKS